MMDDPTARTLPIAVDLDKTLIYSDTLHDAVVAAFFAHPIRFALAVIALIKGRAAFKAAIFDIVEPDIAGLPVRTELVQYLQSEREIGRDVVLVTATAQAIADGVATRFDNLFSSAHGTKDGHNLKGEAKAEFLTKKFPDGFVYAGDSRADLQVWSHAKGIIFAGASSDTQRAARKLGVPIENAFENPRGGLRSWRKALRLHQWAKNLLIFVALILSGEFVNLASWGIVIAAFFLVGIAASGTYVINDLADLTADRRHRTKKSRPFASGALSPVSGLMVAAILISGALVTAYILNPMLGIGLVSYLVITMSYSFGLKRVAMLDVFLIASLFTVRIVLGAFAIGAVLSEWLLTFSMFFFLSLSFAKRHVEVAAADPGTTIRGRGYSSDDAPLTLVFGVGSGTAAILILVLYLVEDAFPSGLYAFPEALWSAPMLILLWVMRIWLLAHRGQLDDDPVAFAVKDRISLWLGVALAGGFFAALIPVGT